MRILEINFLPFLRNRFPDETECIDTGFTSRKPHRELVDLTAMPALRPHAGKLVPLSLGIAPEQRCRMEQTLPRLAARAHVLRFHTYTALGEYLMHSLAGETSSAAPASTSQHHANPVVHAAC